MSSSVITQVILPMALFMIMLGVGMSLRLADFRLLISKPKVVVVGLVLQLLLLPCLGLLVVTLFNLPPALAVGIMILTFAPGGATSNMITYLSRGDTALSVCLTGICGLITPLTMPLLTAVALGYWMEQGAAIEFPVMMTMVKLFVIAVLPAFIGALIRYRWPMFCEKSEKSVKLLAGIFLLLVVTGIVKSNWDKLPELIMLLGPAVLVLVLLAMTAGYAVAQKFKFNAEQSITLSVEVGIQNAATALLITGGILQSSEMSASALIYGVLMNIPAFMLIAYRNRSQKSLQTRA